MKKVYGLHVMTRIMNNVVINDNNCWIFSGTTNIGGYRQIKVVVVKGQKRKMKFVHRLTYEHIVGPIPFGLFIDHLCRNRACCNPLHLEPVTIQENIRRGDVGKVNTNKTHCKHGHEFNKDNTRVYFHNDGRIKHRACRVCDAQRHMEARKLKRM